MIEQAGGEVLTDTRVARFNHDGGRVTGVATADGRTFDAPHAVAALPPQSLARLIPSGWRARRPLRDLPAFQPSSYLWFDR